MKSQKQSKLEKAQKRLADWVERSRMGHGGEWTEDMIRQTLEDGAGELSKILGTLAKAQKASRI